MFAVLFLVFTALLISACGSSESGGPPNFADQTPGALRITNHSSHTVDTFLESPASSTNIASVAKPLAWNYMLLTTFTTNSSRDISLLFPQAYNFCAGSGGYYACMWNVNVAPGAIVPIEILDNQFGGRLQVANATGATISDMYYKQQGTPTWLSYGTINLANGSNITVPFPAGTWDFRFVYSGTNHDSSGTAITAFTVTPLNLP